MASPRVMLFVYALIAVLSASCDMAQAACSLGCNTTIQSMDSFTFYCCNGENAAPFVGKPVCGSVVGQGPFSDNTCATKGYATYAPPPPSPPPSACPNGARRVRIIK